MTAHVLKVLSAMYRPILKKGLLINAMMCAFVSVANASECERITKNQSGANIGSETDQRIFTELQVINDNGAAIKYDNTSWMLGNVYADFDTNEIAKTSTGDKYGGAIYNKGSIGDIIGNFVKNGANSTSGRVYGGAIYNEGTFGNLNGNYDNNSAITTATKDAFGGAIYNKKTIGNISGSFTNNTATSGSSTVKGGKVQGGAIWNSSTIKDITASFNGNKAISKIVNNDGDTAQGGQYLTQEALEK